MEEIESKNIMELFCCKEDKKDFSDDSLFLCARYDVNSLVSKLPKELVFVILEVKQAVNNKIFLKKMEKNLGCFIPKFLNFSETFDTTLLSLKKNALMNEINNELELSVSRLKVETLDVICKNQDFENESGLSGEVYCSHELGIFSDSESEMSEISEESDAIALTEKSKEQDSSCQIQ
ncbi:MAG: hypothetical protein H0T62_02730 [Parachlamydiaceae bacterium]|nr:hypothetical protein [Parachlamydiaceae bacterium]